MGVIERPTNNLPILLSRFIGRAHELSELKRLLSAHRLVTLTGPGGGGKTRLAIMAGRQELDAFAGGVWWVELAALADETLVAQAVANALNVRPVPNEPFAETLTNFLRAQELLLVIDNCEHLITACADLIRHLLEACPDLRILATSREPLAIAGETAYRVPVLSLPEAGDDSPTHLLHSEAVRLFVDRARSVKPDFVLTDQNARAIAQICRRLDGIPLAIELAAARVKLLTVEHIDARLSDRFNLLTTGARTALPRHQTLRATVDWSYDLLPEEARLLFRRLAVFAGGFTLEAAEHICAGAPLAPRAVLDLLARLVDRSLVIVDLQQEPERYRMLETIHEYAHERLEESGEAEAVRHFHAEFFLELAERVPSTMTGEARKARYARFDMEQDNLRAALGWALATRHAELGLCLVGALGEYWFWWANRWNEGWSWISQFLALPEAAEPTRARAKALRSAVILLRYQGDYAEANRLADQSLSLFRELGDKSGMAWALMDKCAEAKGNADYTGAESLCKKSLALFREIGDRRGIGWALHWLAATLGIRGRFDQAAALLKESVQAVEAAGDDAMLGMIYMNSAGLAYCRGDYARAGELVSQAMALSRAGGDADGVNYQLLNLAIITLAQGDLDRAASQFEASEEWFRRAGQRHGLSAVLHHLGYVRHLQGDDRAAGALLREALALQKQQQLKLLLIQILERCAWVSADMHQPQRAARLFGTAERAREQIGAPLPPGDKPLYDRHLAHARADLDKTTFDAAWVAGRAMATEQAVEYALEMPLTPEEGVTLPKKRQDEKQKFGGLTGREREIAARIAQGESNREIAERLVVSERTVETHVTNILNKLGFTSRAQIRKWALEKGLVKRE